jgi:hypothetical protein
VIEGFRAALLGSGPVPWDLIGIGGVARCSFSGWSGLFHQEGTGFRRRRMTMSQRQSA